MHARDFNTRGMETCRGSIPPSKRFEFFSDKIVCLGCVSNRLFALLDLCVSSLRRGHANILCVVQILTDDRRRESTRTAFRDYASKRKVTRVHLVWQRKSRFLIFFSKSIWVPGLQRARRLLRHSEPRSPAQGAVVVGTRLIVVLGRVVVVVGGGARGGRICKPPKPLKRVSVLMALEGSEQVHCFSNSEDKSVEYCT